MRYSLLRRMKRSTMATEANKRSPVPRTSFLDEQVRFPLGLAPVPYVGQAGGRKMSAELRRLGVGELLQPGDFPPTRFPYALDNGAYRAHSREESWDARTFEGMLTLAERFGNRTEFHRRTGYRRRWD